MGLRLRVTGAREGSWVARFDFDDGQASRDEKNQQKKSHTRHRYPCCIGNANNDHLTSHNYQILSIDLTTQSPWNYTVSYVLIVMVPDPKLCAT